MKREMEERVGQLRAEQEYSVERATYSEETQTLIGVRQKVYLDVETGEKITVNQINKRVYGSKSFWKCYLMDFMAILGLIDNKQVDILIYIVNNTKGADNIFLGTYERIAKNVGVTHATIAKILKKLEAHNFIKRIQNGAFFVNPNILMKGDDRKKQMLVSYYNAEDPMDEINSKKKEKKDKEKKFKNELGLDLDLD